MNGKEPVVAALRLYAEDTSRLPVLVIIRLTGQELLHPCDWFLTEQCHSFIIFSITCLGADPGPVIIDTAFLKFFHYISCMIILSDRKFESATSGIAIQHGIRKFFLILTLIHFLQRHDIRLLFAKHFYKLLCLFHIARFLQTMCI